MENLKAEQRRKFPYNENLIALHMVIMADLSETQRERMNSTMVIQNILITDLTPIMVKNMFRELFCVTQTSLDAPVYRRSYPSTKGGGKGSPGSSHLAGDGFFCVLDEGELEGSTGFWVEDDQTLEVGFFDPVDESLALK